MALDINTIVPASEKAKNVATEEVVLGSVVPDNGTIIFRVVKTGGSATSSDASFHTTVYNQ